jgi:hypothetical protein
MASAPLLFNVTPPNKTTSVLSTAAMAAAARAPGECTKPPVS